MLSNSSDIDLAARTMTDDFGLPIEDCLNNWGSFADDEPLPPQLLPPVARRPSPRQSPRPSPRSSPPIPHPRLSPPPPQYSNSKYHFDQHYHYHGHPPPPPPPPPHSRGYYNTPSPYYRDYHYPQHRYPPDQQPWSSPRAFDYPPPRIESPPRKKSKLATPRKDPPPSRSPFRSPPPSSKQHQSIYRRSPIWGGGGTPNIHMCESFGMETSASLEQHFSPIPPTFTPFDDDTQGFDGEHLHPNLSVVAANEQRDRARTVIRQRRDPSAGYNYFEGLSPPPKSTRPPDSSINPYERHYSSERHPTPPDSASKRPASSKRPAFTSPLRSHRKIPPSYLSHEYAEPRVARIDDRKGNESYYQGHHREPLPAPPTQRPRASPRPVPPQSHHQPPHFSVNLTTPRRSTSHHHMYPHSASRVTPSNSASRYPPPPGSSSNPKGPPTTLPGQTPYNRVPPSAVKSNSAYGRPSNGPKPVSYHPSSATKTSQVYTPVAGSLKQAPVVTVTKNSSPSSTSKENVTPAKQQRRNPCNCKKSKCLKLYCECFAAELFCDGCNCTTCHNTSAPEHVEQRNKAKKHCKANNPHAFKPKVGNKGPATSPANTHNTGCKCKQSKCLKKYCECFQARIFCGDKCKCRECKNFQNSQELIDKRLKMKDEAGAALAMGVTRPSWTGNSVPSQSHRSSLRGPSRSPASSRMPIHRSGPGMMRSPPLHYPISGHHPHLHHSTVEHPSHYMGPPSTHMMGPPPRVGYPPMSMHPSTPAHTNLRPPSGNFHSSERSKGPSSRPPYDHRRGISTPRTPAVRIGYDPHSSKRKRKLRLGAEESKIDYFGGLPHQPKTTALAIFSFLSNDDLYNAGLVNRKWSKLAVDEELWNFSSLS
mmetsp:Transcript_20195/g.29205  ORF Transcript_20195/g.29205 Transcript_20195/m.29205 type:complete len:873 (+) Transcript_20195:137-2755(+)